MGRNKLIYATARVTLVVTTSSGKDGTWEGAIESLGKCYGPVAVWTGMGAGQGNEALVARGARDVASLDELCALTVDGTATGKPQLSLEL